MRFFIPFLLFILVSCSQQSSSSDVSNSTNVSTDSLIRVWNKAWNDRDSAAIASQFTEDAILLSNAKELKGRAEITGKFVSHFYKSMVNLQTQKIYESTSGNIAFQAGTYSHLVEGADSTKKTIAGGYSFVWKQQEDKSWKLQYLELE